MISTRFASIATVTVLAGALAACAPMAPSQQVSTYPAGGTYPNTPVQTTGIEYGRITNIEYLQGTAPNSNSGTAGTVIGGIAGGVLGNQVGGGSGRAVATVLGAVGGAVIGNRIGKNRDGSAYTGPAYRVTVQADNGAWRTYEVSATGDLRVGDRVRVDNGVIYRS